MIRARVWQVLLIVVLIWFGYVTMPRRYIPNHTETDGNSGDTQNTTVCTTTTTTTTAEITTTTTTTTTEIKKEILLTFLGDCTMASNHGNNYADNMEYYLCNYPSTYFFEKCNSYIQDDDFTIANCENVFATKNARRIGKGYSPAFWFKTDPCHANVFSDNAIEIVSIANNHTNDYGTTGLESTKQALTNAGVVYGEHNVPIILEKQDVKIGLICVTFWNEWYVDEIIQTIHELNEKTDIQIVFFHGGKERLHSPEKWKVAGCKKFVDEGADLIVGGHPHVLQPYEEYNGVSIMYSIGNFCFGGNRSPENRTVLYQHKFTLNGKKQIIKSEENIIPFYVFTGKTNNWQPAQIEDEKIKKQVLDFVYGREKRLFF